MSGDEQIADAPMHFMQANKNIQTAIKRKKLQGNYNPPANSDNISSYILLAFKLEM